MKRLFLSAVIMFACLIQALPVHAQFDAYRNEVILLAKVLEKKHCLPPPVDDKLSELALDEFIRRIDPQHMILLKADVERLNAYRDKIDDELRGESWTFLAEAGQIYRQRLEQADSMATLILSQPFDLSTSDSIQLPLDKLPFAESRHALQSRWNKWLRYKLMLNICENDTTESSAGEHIIAFDSKSETEERGRLRAIQDRKFRRILDHPWGFNAYLTSEYCNAIAACFDPHTVFMPQQEKENFESAVTGVVYSFGLVLGENDRGNVVIAFMQPGSPAWKSGELHKDDILLKLKWEGKPEKDISALGANEIYEMMADYNHQKLWLTVRGTEGKQKTVALTKAPIREDENFVKSYILKGEKRIGFISLPGFYTQWESKEGSSCANDVAKEILKLKKDTIDGLIIDLRFNGGGSMKEAIDMAGIFIDEGPICFARNKDGKPFSLKDMNRGTIYDGPLLVMINGQSASASEVLAAALQDYHRAVIVGSPSYGKASMQEITPLDTMADYTSGRLRGKKSDMNFVKVTTGRLYRVTGKSNQLSGVQPDILIPDAFMQLKRGEASYRHVLIPDTVKRSNYYHPLPLLQLDYVKQASEERVKASASFKTVNELSLLVSDIFENGRRKVPLKWENFKVYQRQQMEKRDKLVAALDKTGDKPYSTFNNSFDKEPLALDKDAAEINEENLDNVNTDIGINESYRILLDFISHNETDH